MPGLLGAFTETANLAGPPTKGASSSGCPFAFILETETAGFSLVILMRWNGSESEVLVSWTVRVFFSPGWRTPKFKAGGTRPPSETISASILNFTNGVFGSSVRNRTEAAQLPCLLVQSVSVETVRDSPGITGLLLVRADVHVHEVDVLTMLIGCKAVFVNMKVWAIFAFCCFSLPARIIGLLQIKPFTA